MNIFFILKEIRKYSINICLITGYYGLTKLLISLSKGDEEFIRKYCRLLIIYSIISLTILLHYRQEPIGNHSFYINIIIIGEAVSAIILILILIFISFMNSEKYFEHKNNDLNDLIHINENFIQDISEDEEIETFNKIKVKKTMRQRSRSRTPTNSTEL